VVLDTSVIVDYLRGIPAAGHYVDALPGVPVCSEVTRTELLRGMRSDERVRTGRFLEQMSWVVIDDVLSRRAGELGRQFRASHGLLGVAELLIAATAEVHELPLATRNVKHFPMFPDLRPPYGEPVP
jgi:predicted nucleic acid-binding protein